MDEIRRKIPIIDASIQKIIRLVGEFEVKAQGDEAQRETDKLLKSVRVGGASTGIKQFVGSYLEDMLVYGNAVGEIVLGQSLDGVSYLYNAPCNRISVRQGKSPFELEFFVSDGSFGSKRRLVKNSELILFTPLNPKSGSIVGRPIIEGLDFMGEILVRIFTAMAKSYERIGDLRYAVSYLPKGELSFEEASKISKELGESWERVMAKDSSGRVSDFLTVGNIDIKKIGADTGSLEVKEQIRACLEQIIGKLGIPPFMLGISWSSTERMSKQQADILTSEIKNYRQLLSPVIEKICKVNLELKGISSDLEVNWKSISLDDEVEIARAKLLDAKAREAQKEDD